MGADVIKIEAPSGDESRRIPPFKDDTPHPEKSLYFLHFNTNKRSITLDVEKPDGRAVFLELVRKTDVVLETARPGRMDELGIGCPTLRAQNSGLVYAAISPFGQSGPWRDYKANDMAGIALGNLLYLAGEPGEPPLQPPGEIAYGMASTYGAFGIAVALYHRLDSGKGQYIARVRRSHRRIFYSQLRLHWRKTGARLAQRRRDRSLRSLCDQERLCAHIHHSRRTMAPPGRLDGKSAGDFRPGVRENVLPPQASGHRDQMHSRVLREAHQRRII
jgi:crotonobetainyl-CoA:carnitine CoA-transferase CaiB-like acyl-CoA transferase